jgi:hypothetical protein
MHLSKQMLTSEMTIWGPYFWAAATAALAPTEIASAMPDSRASTQALLSASWTQLQVSEPAAFIGASMLSHLARASADVTLLWCVS